MDLRASERRISGRAADSLRPCRAFATNRLAATDAERSSCGGRLRKRCTQVSASGAGAAMLGSWAKGCVADCSGNEFSSTRGVGGAGGEPGFVELSVVGLLHRATRSANCSRQDIIPLETAQTTAKQVHAHHDA
jgi:hypothetical protein